MQYKGPAQIPIVLWRKAFAGVSVLVCLCGHAFWLASDGLQFIDIVNASSDKSFF
jgi:hypothetical protein